VLIEYQMSIVEYIFQSKYLFSVPSRNNIKLKSNSYFVSEYFVNHNEWPLDCESSIHLRKTSKTVSTKLKTNDCSLFSKKIRVFIFEMPQIPKMVHWIDYKYCYYHNLIFLV